MSADKDSPEALEIVLEDPGPYILPICDDGVTLMVGELFAVLVAKTLDDQEIQIPFPLSVLKKLRDLADAAVAVEAHGGKTLQ